MRSFHNANRCAQQEATHCNTEAPKTGFQAHKAETERSASRNRQTQHPSQRFKSLSYYLIDKQTKSERGHRRPGKHCGPTWVNEHCRTQNAHSFLGPHGTLTKTDDILGHKTSLNKLKIQVTFCIFSDNKEIILDLNYRKMAGKFSHL